MKSKYLDIKKLKQPFQEDYQQKISRKQTKPKKSYPYYHGQQNQTESDNRIFSKSQQDKKYKYIQNNSKRNDKNKKNKLKNKYTQTESQKIDLNSNQQSQQKLRQKQSKSFQKKRKSDSYHQNSNFIGQLNSYLKQLKKSKLDLKQKQQYHQKYQNVTLPINKLQKFKQSKSGDKNNTVLNTNRLQKKIKKQKTINRNLQKCIIQIQKVLWDRNDTLEMLQNQMRRQFKLKDNFINKKINHLIDNNDKINFSKTMFINENKFQNKTQPIHRYSQNKNIFYHPPQSETSSPLNQYSKIQSRNKTLQQLLQQKSSKMSSRFLLQKQVLKSENDTQKQSDTTFKQKPRRKTQSQINKIFSKTLLNNKKEKFQNDKSYKRFSNKDLYQL